MKNEQILISRYKVAAAFAAWRVAYTEIKGTNLNSIIEFWKYIKEDKHLPKYNSDGQKSPTFEGDHFKVSAEAIHRINLLLGPYPYVVVKAYFAGEENETTSQNDD